MAFYQLFHLILHEIDRFGCFMLKSGFFSKILVLCLRGAFIGRVIFPINKMCGASFEGHCLFLCLFACFFFFLQRELFLVFGAFQPSKSSII